jgi:hypothetical protein
MIVSKKVKGGEKLIKLKGEKESTKNKKKKTHKTHI